MSSPRATFGSRPPTAWKTSLGRAKVGPVHTWYGLRLLRSPSVLAIVASVELALAPSRSNTSSSRLAAATWAAVTGGISTNFFIPIVTR